MRVIYDDECEGATQIVNHGPYHCGHCLYWREEGQVGVSLCSLGMFLLFVGIPSGRSRRKTRILIGRRKSAHSFKDLEMTRRDYVAIRQLTQGIRCIQNMSCWAAEFRMILRQGEEMEEEEVQKGGISRNSCGGGGGWYFFFHSLSCSNPQRSHITSLSLSLAWVRESLPQPRWRFRVRRLILQNFFLRSKNKVVSRRAYKKWVC